MVNHSNPSDLSSGPSQDLAARLSKLIRGEVRFDVLTRTLFSTDASIYEMVPAGVVFPRIVDDVVATVRECREAGTSVVARGAGTGLTGGAIGNGVQLDLSRYMNRMGRVDLQGGTVEVEPGVVLDELNARLAAKGLQFAPDVATSSRATIGGMIANNSCGAHSVLYGRTVDHVVGLTIVMGDGRVVSFGDAPRAMEPGEGHSAATVVGGQPRDSAISTRDGALQIERELGHIRDRYHQEIQSRYPKVMRSNGGYGLDRLGPPGVRADAVKILCGSEGTLGIVVAAKLKLVPLPQCKGMVVLQFDDLPTALEATPNVLAHAPAAVELVDRMIVSAGRRNSALGARCTFLKGDPEALLAIEFFAENSQTLLEKMNALAADGPAVRSALGVNLLADAETQNTVWELRKSGLGLLMSRPGDAQPYAFVEDSAVDPKRLGEYIRRFRDLLRNEGVEAGYYAHASVGCIHVKPVLNLKSASDIERMGRIAGAVVELALEFGGTMTGEHGDGILRSCWLEKLYGPQILAAFKEVKDLFDPLGVLNPHKIVDPWPMTEHLRYGSEFKAQPVKTHMDFSAHEGMAGLAGMCTGVGQCRQRLVGTMCPSYMATGDEKHTTRARANALRVALSNRGLLQGLDDPQMAEVMDLCLSCKACKTECPTGVDMARLKAEWLSNRHLRHGVDSHSRFIADVPRYLARGSRFPRLNNFLLHSTPIRVFLERRYGMDRRIPAPRLATRTFRSWWQRRRGRFPLHEKPRDTVVYLVDTWTNHCTPEVGQAAVVLLERAGFHVICPEVSCCGRPAISKGLLHEATLIAETNVGILSKVAEHAVAIVGSEPSCLFTLVDEYPQLVRTAAARRVASQAMMLESFLVRTLETDRRRLSFKPPRQPVLYHAHCHQKALVGSTDAAALLARIWGRAGTEIKSGCCGMAGSFGHEKEHYEVARAIGEDRLFPVVRARGSAEIAVSGFSCGIQIAHHCGVHVRHLLEYMKDALDDSVALDR